MYMYQYRSRCSYWGIVKSFVGLDGPSIYIRYVYKD